MNRRILLGALGLALLVACAGTLAYCSGGQTEQQSHSPATQPSPSHDSAASPTPSTAVGTVPRPARVADPLEFAKAAAKMLWSYDTRNTSHPQQLAGMRAWMTSEGKYADWESVSAQLPTPALWARMGQQRQRATATARDAHYPSAFKQALAEDPAALTEAYIYAVTVTGKQHLVWRRGGQGAEGRSLTLAVQCRPSHVCSLVAIAPRVAP